MLNLLRVGVLYEFISEFELVKMGYQQSQIWVMRDMTVPITSVILYDDSNGHECEWSIELADRCILIKIPVYVIYLQPLSTDTT